MPVGIREVAREAGVSLQTVSNVLNGRPGASDQTRRRVWEVARRLGYRRNLNAANLRSARTGGIGLLVATADATFPADAHQAHLLAGLTEQLLDDGLNPPAIQVHRHEYVDESAFPLFHHDGIAVVIVALFLPKAAGRRWIDAIEEMGYPCVLIEQLSTAKNVASVLTDQQQGALEATQHLLRQGHRRIALVTARHGTGEIDERRLGYNRAMALWGFGTPDRIIVETENTIAGGYEATSALLKEAPRPTAVVTVSDLLALGSIEAARTAALRVPEDLAVVGFEDMEFAAHIDPPLSSVRVPDRALGAAAARLAVSYVRDGTFAQQRIVLPTSLHVRASSVADGRNAERTPGFYQVSRHPETSALRRAAQNGAFRIGVALASIDNPWRTSMYEQLQLEAQRDQTIAELVIRDAQANAEQQVRDIVSLVNERVDALIVDPAAGPRLVPAVEEAWTAGIPVVMLDSAVPTDHYATKVGPDEVLVGKVAAEDLIQRIGHGNIVIFEGPAGWPVVDDRSRGMAMALRSHRDVTVLARAPVPRWSREQAKEIMRDWLLMFPSIDGVLAHDGLMAIGALEAAQEAGRADGLRLGLIGTYNRALKHIAETGEGITVLIPTWIGAECVRVARRILQGEEVPKCWDMGIITISRDNVFDWYDPAKPGESFESLLHE